MHVRTACVAVAAAALLAVPAPPAGAQAAADAAPKYRLKRDGSGSLIPDTYARATRYPLDRPYAEFTEAEKAALREEYEGMPATDEPPFPEKGLRPIIEQVSQIVSRARVEGEVSIFVTVDATGEATDVSLVRYPHRDVARAVAWVLVNTRYKPAVCGGQPCRMQWPFRTVLRLR